MSYWTKKTDRELQEELERNEGRLRCIDPKERAIARNNIEAILKEQTERHERKYGLTS